MVVRSIQKHVAVTCATIDDDRGVDGNRRTDRRIPAITAVLTVLTGIASALIGGYVLNAMRIEDPAARGFAMGLAGHGIATARAFQESETAGTFSGLAMALNALATAMLTPFVVRLLVH